MTRRNDHTHNSINVLAEFRSDPCPVPIITVGVIRVYGVLICGRKKDTDKIRRGREVRRKKGGRGGIIKERGRGGKEVPCILTQLRSYHQMSPC